MRAVAAERLLPFGGTASKLEPQNRGGPPSNSIARGSHHVCRRIASSASASFGSLSVGRGLRISTCINVSEALVLLYVRRRHPKVSWGRLTPRRSNLCEEDLPAFKRCLSGGAYGLGPSLAEADDDGPPTHRFRFGSRTGGIRPLARLGNRRDHREAGNVD